MIPFIMIIIVHSTLSPLIVTTQQFNSLESCESARNVIIQTKQEFHSSDDLIIKCLKN